MSTRSSQVSSVTHSFSFFFRQSFVLNFATIPWQHSKQSSYQRGCATVTNDNCLWKLQFQNAILKSLVCHLLFIWCSLCGVYNCLDTAAHWPVSTWVLRVQNFTWERSPLNQEILFHWTEWISNQCNPRQFVKIPTKKPVVELHSSCLRTFDHLVSLSYVHFFLGCVANATMNDPAVASASFGWSSRE